VRLTTVIGTKFEGKLTVDGLLFVASKYVKSPAALMLAVRDCACCEIAGIWLRSPHKVKVYELPAVTTIGEDVEKVHVIAVPLTDEVASVGEMLFPFESCNTTVLMNDEVAVLLKLSFKVFSWLSPAAFEVNVREPICWKLAGGKLPTEEPVTASVLLKIVWALPEAFESVTPAVLFEVEPRATKPVVVAIWKVVVLLSVIEPAVCDPASPFKVSESELPDGMINGLVKLVNE
jgi:hypothetical protein